MKKEFRLTFTLDEWNKLSCDTVNQGMDAFMVIGLLHWKLEDIYKQLRGEIKPDVINRTVIVEKE